jgi:hypothetical protein
MASAVNIESFPLIIWEILSQLGLGFYSQSDGQMTPIVFNLWHQRL